MENCIELGNFEAIRNGVPLKYRIQTVTPDLVDIVLELMVNEFLLREPLTSYANFHDDPVALEELVAVWRKLMATGSAIVALEDTKDKTINVIGANMTLVVHKDLHEDENYQSEKSRRLFKTMEALCTKGNLFEKYNVDKYLGAYGLSVNQKYHGYQIGYRLLEARRKLCESLGLTVSGTVFTAQVSQHIARKVGFEVLSQEDYKKTLYEGKQAYPNLDGDMKFMGIKYT